MAKFDESRFEDADGYTNQRPVDDLGNWTGPPDEFFTNKYPAPDVPGGPDHPGKGVTRVSTEALKLFANNIRSLLPALRDVLGKLDDVKLAPGAFYDAHQLIVKVQGAGEGNGLVPTTREFVEKAINAITVVADELEKLAAAYATAEELNKATGKDLGEHIADAQSYIASATGVSASTTGFDTPSDTPSDKKDDEKSDKKTSV